MAGVAMLTLFTASCGDDDDYTAGPQVTGQGVAFDTQEASASLKFIPDSNGVSATSCTFKAVRMDSTEAVNIPVEVIQNDSVDSVACFNLPDTLHFNAGQGTLSFEVSFPKAKMGTSYTFEIAIPKEYQNYYKTCNLRRTVLRDYNWIDYEGHLTFGFLGADGDVVIQHADGANRWRVVNPFASGYSDANPINYTYVASELDFSVNADSSVVFTTFKSEVYSDGSQIWGFYPSDLSPKVAQYDAYSALTSPTTAQLVPYCYILGLGGFGLKELNIELTSPDVTFMDK